MKKLISLILVICLLAAAVWIGHWLIKGYSWTDAASLCQLPFRQPQSGEVQFSRLLPFGTDVINNYGGVCFYPAGYDFDALPTNNLKVQIYSSGCYSSSCSRVFGRTGQMEVDSSNFEVRFESAFAIKALDIPCACSEDCGGAGMLEFETGPLQNGSYKVYIGDSLVGTLVIPFNTNNLCLDTSQPAK